MTSLSFEACGASEWSARLPNALLAIAVVVMTIAFGRRFWGPRVGLLAGLILASSGLFFGLAGSCILDMSLAASVTCALMSFALFASREEAGASQGTWWGRAFFFSLALGGLAKGPVALVLVGLAAGAWIAAAGRWQLVRRLPWITGLSILVVVVCPWYIAAERATPGFLHYFLLNEHLLRYIRAEYGDLYGAGRTQPYGASWLMLAVTFLPWSPLFVRYGIERWRDRKSETQTAAQHVGPVRPHLGIDAGRVLHVLPADSRHVFAARFSGPGVGDGRISQSLAGSERHTMAPAGPAVDGCRHGHGDRGRPGRRKRDGCGPLGDCRHDAWRSSFLERSPGTDIRGPCRRS